jgi:hypothetical protein
MTKVMKSDEHAKNGHTADAPVVCSGPQKFASLTLQASQQVRDIAQKRKILIPRNSAPSHKILKGIVAANLQRAASKHSTIFVCQLLKGA